MVEQAAQQAGGRVPPGQQQAEELAPDLAPVVRRAGEVPEERVPPDPSLLGRRADGAPALLVSQHLVHERVDVRPADLVRPAELRVALPEPAQGARYQEEGHVVERVPQGPGELEVPLPGVDEGAGRLPEEEVGGRVEREAVEEGLQVDGGGAAVPGQQAEQARDVRLDEAQVRDLVPGKVRPEQRPRGGPLVPVAGEDALAQQRAHDALPAAEREVLEAQGEEGLDVLWVRREDGAAVEAADLPGRAGRAEPAGQELEEAVVPEGPDVGDDEVESQYGVS